MLVPSLSCTFSYFLFKFNFFRFSFLVCIWTKCRHISSMHPIRKVTLWFLRISDLSVQDQWDAIWKAWVIHSENYSLLFEQWLLSLWKSYSSARVVKVIRLKKKKCSQPNSCCYPFTKSAVQTAKAIWSVSAFRDAGKYFQNVHNKEFNVQRPHFCQKTFLCWHTVFQTARTSVFHQCHPKVPSVSTFVLSLINSSRLTLELAFGVTSLHWSSVKGIVFHSPPRSWLITVVTVLSETNNN